MDRGRRFATSPLGIVLVYAVVGAAWILFSDRLVEVALTGGARAVAQSVKGTFYVVATAALLYLLIRRHAREREALDAEVRTVLDAMTDAAVVVDAAGQVVLANAAAAALAGARSRGDLLAPMADLMSRLHLARADGRLVPYRQSATAQALRGEIVTGYEARVRGPDGLERFVSVSSAPVRSARRGGRLVLTVIRDLTDERRLEETREDFLSTAAHELKTPLAVIKAHAQLMSRRGQGDAAALGVIERQVERLTTMVQQMLEVSRFRIGAGELRRDRFDAGVLLAEAAEGVRVRHPGRTVLVRVDDPAPVVADRERIAQVMAALLQNAMRFSPAGAGVEAVAARRGGEALISVRDRGTGIAPHRAERVFDRYYPVRSGADDGGRLGLGICREIVARHGGHVGFETEVGRGSTFWFSLPLAAERP